jgi:hypothetical protein
MEPRVFLEEFVDDGVVLFDGHFFALGLDGAADLFFEEGDVACLFF